MAHWKFGAGRGGPKNARTVLWRWLLPGAVHILEIQPEAIYTVHVAGKCAHNFFCFTILLEKKDQENPIYFSFLSSFLQGRHATQDEIAACAYQAVTVDSKYNGAPVQVRVVMGKEPRHFLAIFKGKFIIFEVQRSYFFLNPWKIDYMCSPTDIN